MLSAVHTPSNPLVEAVDALVAEPVDDLSESALGIDLVEIRRQIDRLEGEFLRRLSRFDRSRAALADGAVSTVTSLRAQCRVTGSVAMQRVRMARVLAELPAARGSLCAGRASFPNISMITQLADDVGTESVRTVEETLVTAAQVLDPGRMRYLAMATRMRLDADGALDQDNRNHERRWFACDQTFGKVFILRGELDAEGGAILKTALDAHSAPSGNNDSRNGSQRRADALVDLASRVLQSGGLRSVHGQRPHLTLTASIEALRGQPGAEPAQIDGVGPVHPQTARRVACDSVCTVVTVASTTSPAIGAVATTAKPLSVGHATRVIPAHIRTALVVRDKGCRFPGCDRPPQWTDGHHIKHWADGGPAELTNLLLLCRLHHRFVHEKGWRVCMEESAPVIAAPP